MLIRVGTFFMLCALSVTAMAKQPVHVARYTILAPVATEAQKNPMSVIVTIPFQSNITTVGQAINFLLIRSGYRLASAKDSDPALPVLLSSPLPLVQRKLGPIRLSNALKTLAGPAWDLVVDPVHRLISYELKNQYRQALKND